MTLKQQIAKDVDTVFFNENDYAESGTYIFANNTQKTIKILPLFGQNLADGALGQKAQGIVELKKADVPEPKFKDKVVFGGQTYLVEKIEHGADGLVWRVTVRWDVRFKV